MINFTINSKNENGETLEIYINDILSVILTKNNLDYAVSFETGGL